MIQYTIDKGSTSRILEFPVYDSSSSVGAKLAGLVFNTASLKAYYNREGTTGAATAITLVTATKGTYTSSGFIAVDATNQTGNYQLHVPNAAIASGADYVHITIEGAANMVPVDIKVHLREAGFSTTEKASINAEMVDVMATDTHAEIGRETPGEVVSYNYMLRYAYKRAKNKTLSDRTAGYFYLYNHAGTTVDQKQAITEADPNVTLGPASTGP